MPPVRLISFDAFETLISPRFSPALVYSRAAKKIDIDVQPHELAPKYIESYRHYRKKYPNFGSYNGISASDWWAKVIRKALTPFVAPNQEIPSSFCASLFEQYNSAELWRLEPTALTCLEAIRQLEPKPSLSVLSNFDERLPRILQELDIAEFFDDILFSCDFPFHKPDPRFFQALLDRHTSIDATHCLHIGNSLERDYVAALTVGMQALLYNPSQTKIDPQVKSITALLDLLPILENSK